MEAIRCATVVPVAPVSSATVAQRSRARFAAGSRRHVVAAPVALRSVCRAQASSSSFQKDSDDVAISKRDVANKAVTTEAPPMSELEENCINSIRFLAIDAVEKANSGHPGLPMGCAPMSYVLFKEFMAFNPKNPAWFNRDRFVLSAGHGCMLQYALLHLTGYDSVSLDDIKQFRQVDSCTPGHPENFETAGIEVTTGPLGQGISQAVGLALAETHLAARFNKPDCTVVDHYTYVIMGDGCCQEGVANEAASLAGHWGLGKLIALYDDNKISIDGSTDISFTEDVLKRHEAMGWHVIHVEDGNRNLDSIKKAIEEAKAVTDKPTMIKVSTTIGYGSPNKANSYLVHGAALGTDEVAATRQELKWNYEPFEIPQEVYDQMSGVSKGADLEAAWDKTMSEYAEKYPEDAAEFKQLISGELPEGWADALPTAKSDTAGNATRIHSQTMLNSLAPVLPGLIGGSADLAPSNMTLMKMFGDFQKDTPTERNVRFGVREFGMGCIGIGIALHNSGLIPYVATFFIFTDYMRAAMRLSALSQAGVIYVTTHDSIGLGEDGPTHQPVEHLASFRAMPGILTFRPGDLTETAGAYKIAIERRKAPTLMVFSRQKMPNNDGTSIEGVAKGGYTVSDNTAEGAVPDVILLGTGSELYMVEEAAVTLREEGKSVRVVSMVCTELFDEQSPEYKESILPAACKARVSMEAASTYGWERYVGTEGKMIGVDTFGSSGPGPALYKKYGLTTEAVVAAAKSF